MKMTNLSSALARLKGCHGGARIAVTLLLFFSVSKGSNEKETTISSSQQENEEHNIKILISESVKNTKTLDLLSEKGVKPTQNVILPTEILTNSSYLEALINNDKSVTERLDINYPETTRKFNEENGINDLELITHTKNFYEAIQPTKTLKAEEPKIEQTQIFKETGSGESKGVSMYRSRPLNPQMMSFKRTKRGYGTLDEPIEEQRLPSKIIFPEDGKRKVAEKNNIGKNYNQIEQTLGKIAKVTFNTKKGHSVNTTITPINFRESREEENRKASPDIKDIISGIVNILNGKVTKQSDGNTGRPRPTGTRINNRGPPRISDVPPLDFDGPPAYRPLPPPPPKRIPPPYPFDIPPSMPSIYLPSQPQKPYPKLPPQTFIDGVPIPKIVIPGEELKKPPANRPPEQNNLDFDTISMIQPVGSPNVPSITSSNTNKTLENPLTDIENSTVESKREKPMSVNVKTGNSTVGPGINQTSPATNSTNTKPDIVKVSGQKIPLSGGSLNKTTNKRVRPNPVIRSTEKPSQFKTTTISSVTEEEKNKTFGLQEETKNPTTEVSRLDENTKKVIQEEISNKTDKAVESSVKVSANTTTTTTTTTAATTLNIKPIQGVETKTNTTSSSNVLSTSFETHDETTKRVETYISEKVEDDLRLPVLLEPSIGIGEATPVLESSILEISMLPTELTKTATTMMSTQRPGQTTMTGTSNVYKARPGIVLDDPEYKPGGHKRPVISGRPIITAPPPHSHYGEIFDVTVHAVQGPEEPSSGKPIIVPVNIDGVQVHTSQINKGDVSVITKPEDGQNFVSIDGKRTYINLFGEVSSTKISPTSTHPPITGTGYAIPHKESSLQQANGRPGVSASPPRRPYKRPSHPPVRIDTCIVGDDTTCDSAQNEMCRTEDGVSSCHCRPGYNRRNHRDTCRRVVSMVTSLRVDRLYNRKVKWQDNLRDPDSEEYQQLSYEASQAIESAMSMTPFSDDFINSQVNSIYTAKNLENNEPAVYVNVTIQLEENLDTVRPAIKHDIQRHLLRVIQRRNNNVGNSAVWVDASPGSVLALQDVDECSSSELHDCHERAVCLNTFGSFKCQCPSSSRDPWVGNIHREGRFCETCSSEFCNNRGECNFEHGQQVCHCSGSFYGSQCEIDGEVLGVAIGASVAAAIIIVLTLICLCMWSRKWSREQKSAVGAGMGSPVFGYMATGPTVKTPSVGSPPYQVSIEDRIRWAQIADVMAKSNHYAQPEPVNKTNRTSFGGYPTLPSHTMSMKGTLQLPTLTPPVPLPRLTLANKQPMGTYGGHSQFGSIHQSNHGMRSSLETSSSEEDADRVDLLGRNFNAPRPKSRTSVANQSGIYYDVDFDRSDAYSKQNTIPLNTYTLNPQHQVRPYFR